MTNATLTNQANDKQLSFLNKLLNEAGEMLDQRQQLTGADWPEARRAVDAMRHFGDFTRSEASTAIDQALDNNRQLRQELKGLRGVQTPAEQTSFVTTGLYQVDGRIFKVLPSRNSERHYAKELVGENATGYAFEYARGAMYRIRPEHRMTPGQAAEFGKLTGTCCCCGKLLTDPASIAKGIGPVCEKKYF